jgi:hypothetical protein
MLQPIDCRLYCYRMHWLVAHAYVVVIGVAAFMIITASAVINRDVATPAQSTGWGRVGGFSLTNTGAQTNIGYTQPRQVVAVENLEATEYSVLPIRSALDTTIDSALPEEWESLLSQLIAPEKAPEKSEGEATDAYSFIPRGLISITEPVEQKTALQQELFDYGNRVGALVRAFDEAHLNMISQLKDAYADRGNGAKRETAEKIGTDYQALGKELESLADVPLAVKSMHLSIARAYQDAGTKMVTKLRAHSDDEFLVAMHAYNASALQFTNSFVALATYLSASGVKFSTSDAGSVFTFTSF